MERPADHPQIPAAGPGVLIVNLGTPDAPEVSAVRRYLKQFLSDRRVVEIPPILWQPVLRGIILNTRPRKSAKAYAKIWTEHGSPLAVETRALAQAIQDRLGGRPVVRHAMRYGNPSIAGALETLAAAGCTRILIVPLYPQYSAATTASVQDEVFRLLQARRWQPSLRFVPPWYDDPAYIEALASDMSAELAGLSFEPQTIIASFHGMPERTLRLGDPYHCHCQKTARLLAEVLGRPLEVTFQSRFGRAKWLEPATDATLERLACSGVKRVAVVAPGFATDCLETLEELAIAGREQFMAAGGSHFAYLPCLNASPAGAGLMEALIRRELAGWI